MGQADFVHDGGMIDHTPGSAVVAGDVIVLGELVTVAPVDIAANRLGQVATEGVYDFNKPGATAYAIGILLYWDDAGNVTTTTSAGNKLIGKVVRAAASADTKVRVKLTH
jgi:predicted RecA/RadA family phage recombinase